MELTFILGVFTYLTQVSAQWKVPSFMSQWYAVESKVTPILTIEHGLGEVPAKVDVQIKVIQNNEEFIFTGTGTAQTDDDYADDFGGVVYQYNNTHVVLYIPNTYGAIAFTGYFTHYDGPSSASGFYLSGYARVRAWKTSDFPEPLFTLNIFISSDPADCYKEQNHGSTILPDLVIAQVFMDDGYISEGQGNIFQEYTTSYTNTLSGVVFGYNQEKVKMWVPSVDTSERCNGVVYAHGDGFWTSTLGLCKTNGTVTLKGYQLNKAFQTTFPAGNGIFSNDTISFGNTYSLETDLVTVQVKQNDNGNGTLEHLIFNGVGSAMPTGKKYSGVVYVYTNNSALLYTPTASNTNGYMIYLADRWGDGQSWTYSRTADVIVTVFSSVCPNPFVPNTTHTLTNGSIDGSVVQYSCVSGYVFTSGNLTRTCSSGVWDGTDPVCSQQNCLDPGPVSNATYTYTNLTVGSTVTYVCDVGFIYEAGNLVRTCQTGGIWDGVSPVCSEQNCLEPEPVSNTAYTYTGLTVGSTVTYVCDVGFIYEAGNLVRTCQTGGIWDGVSPVCSEQNCLEPEPVSNATYTYTGLTVGSTVTYVCDVGFIYEAGNIIRICQTGGIWDGVSPVCSEQNCLDPGPVSNTAYTYTNLTVGSTVTYVCDANFIYEAGNLVRTCQSGGIWDGVPPVCSEQNCPDPGPVSNATYTYTNLTVGSTVTYVCDANFIYEAGNLVRTCQTGGIWDGVPPVCSEQNCLDPGPVSNATYTYTNLTVGSTVTYVCDANFIYEAGNLVRTCQTGGVWDGVPPVCSEQTCPEPESAPNVMYTYTNLTVGSTVTYVCDANFTYVTGNLVRTCQTGGTWDGVSPVCSEVPVLSNVGGLTIKTTYTKMYQDQLPFVLLHMLQGRSYLDCARKCNKGQNCLLFTFNKQMRECILYQPDQAGATVVCSGPSVCYKRDI